MTGYTVHTGSTEKFTQGWDTIFKNNKKTARKAAKKTAAKQTSGKRAAKKPNRKK